MTQTDKCPRFGQTETTNHLLWECEHVKNIWSLFDALMTQATQVSQECINKEEDKINNQKQAATIDIIFIFRYLWLISTQKKSNFN